MPEVELQRRTALIARNESHADNMATKAAKARGTDEDGQVVLGGEYDTKSGK